MKKLRISMGAILKIATHLITALEDSSWYFLSFRLINKYLNLSEIVTEVNSVQPKKIFNQKINTIFDLK